MTLIRWTPVEKRTPSAILADDFERFFDGFFAGSRLVAKAGRVVPPTTAATGRIGFAETEGAYGFTLETPGFPRESIKVEVEGDILTLSGRVGGEGKAEGEGQAACTREFTRRVRLPGRVANEGHAAVVRDGVLTVTLAKLAPRTKEPLRIAVG